MPEPALNTTPQDNKIVRRQLDVSEQLQNSGLPVLLQRIYANRNITQPDELDYSVDKLLDYRKLKDCEKAASIIADTIIADKTILIVGDYDADGATSTAVMLRALNAFGHRRCDHLVPNRFDYGYGLSPEIVKVAIELRPDLIVTVDNGISSIAGVALANENNIAVVVTDHHLAGQELPAAAAIVNPNQPGCDFPSKMIAGVGVAFYVMLAVRTALRDRGWFDSHEPPNMASLLDLVALGTVADVVPLDANNRIMVDLGLRRIRAGASCSGIDALLQVAGKNRSNCCTQDFGFAIAPRLNAAGRLEDMSIGIACLLTDDSSHAIEIAHMLDDINKQRKTIEADMLQQANSIIDQQLREIELPETDYTLSSSVCLYQPEWHQGVVGLLASRIKDRIHRPVIAFAQSDSKQLKGSARSIIGVHIRDALDTVNRRNPGLIIKFGGHAMAAGLTITADALQTFAAELEKAIAEMVDDDMLHQTIETDGSIDAQTMTLANAELLRFAGPWGQHFVEPTFDDDFEVLDWRIVGGKHLKLRLKKVTDEPTADVVAIDAIAFNHTDADLPAGNQLHAAYRLDVNEYNGNKRLQLIVEHIQAV
jgi:single-stranded-DNA-specific exonuclease